MDNFSTHLLYRRHNIDSVMSSLWQFYTRNFMVLFFTSFVMALGVQYIMSMFDFSELQTIGDPGEMILKLKAFIWPMIFISFISLVFTVILHYYIIYNPVDPEITILSAAFKSMRYLVPYLIIIILLAFFGSFAMVLGLFVLIIGVFFAILYLVTLYLFILPILMVEGPSIANAISRTFRLAHRGFWSNLGWVAVLMLILLVASFVFSAIIMLPFTGTFLNALANPEDISEVVNFTSNPVYIILSALTSALYFPMMPIMGVILYFNGRAREDEATIPDTDNEPGRISVDDLYAKHSPDEDRES